MVLKGHTGSVLCLQYNEQVIVTGSSDSTIRYICVCAGGGGWGTTCITVLEITVGLRTLSNHFGHLSDPKMLGSDIWPSTIKGPLP